MPSSKKSHRTSTSRQTPRAFPSDFGKADNVETGGIVASHSSIPGVRKTRGATARHRKKLQNALIKKVDARNSKEAFAEQVELLGASASSCSTSPTEPRPPKSRGRPRRNAKADKKYMDDILDGDEGFGDELQRGKRWIPDFEHRTRPIRQPAGVPYGLWMSYKHLDEYIYRHSLSPAEIEALPLLDDVLEYQNSDGRAPKPKVPQGYEFDENLELVPMRKSI